MKLTLALVLLASICVIKTTQAAGPAVPTNASTSANPSQTPGATGATKPGGDGGSTVTGSTDASSDSTTQGSAYAVSAAVSTVLICMAAIFVGKRIL